MLTRMFTFPVLCLLVLYAVHLSVSQLTDQQKQDLLNLHNRARSMVDPIATNMEKMVGCNIVQGNVNDLYNALWLVEV